MRGCRRQSRPALRLRLRTTDGIAFGNSPLDRLRLHLRGSDDLPVRIYEKLPGAGVEGVLVAPAGRPAAVARCCRARPVQPSGFDEAKRCCPAALRSFQGYRLLQEYFAFPQRFLFVELSGLQPALAPCAGTELEIIVLLYRAATRRWSSARRRQFRACTARRWSTCSSAAPTASTCRTSSSNTTSWPTAPGRWTSRCTRSNAVTGLRQRQRTREQAFDAVLRARSDLGARPGARRISRSGASRACCRSASAQRRAAFELHRQRGLHRARRRGRRRPTATTCASSACRVWCTNRDLPLSMPLGVGKTDFILDAGGAGGRGALPGRAEPAASLVRRRRAWPGA